MEEEIKVEVKPLTPINILMIIVGSILFALSVNLFLEPLNLYAGGIIGCAQLIDTIFLKNLTGMDLAGIINFCFNVPLFIIALKDLNKKMFIGTVISIIVQTIALQFIPIPEISLLDDKLACIAISGIIGGAGCGIILVNGGSGGGLDLLGVYLTKKFKKFSVGKLSLIFNGALYTICAILFNVDTAIYSIIYIAIFSITIDKMHYQNIEIELMIFTHNPKVKEMIMSKYVRGVTCWDGKGAYTNKDTEVLVTIVSKYEVDKVKKDILELDPKAFIIAHNQTEVTGGYQKRLV